MIMVAGPSARAASAEDTDACRLDMHRQSIAIPLQLPTPLVAFGRMRLQLSERRLDAVRHRIEQKLRLRRIALPPRL
jgi:hypothetical protein